MTSLLLLSLAGLLYLFAVARVWQASKGFAIGMLLFAPVSFYVLARYWRDENLGARMPLLAAIVLFGTSWALLAGDLRQLEQYASEDEGTEGATSPMPLKARALDGIGDRLRLSHALGRLPMQRGRVEIAAAGATIDVPQHFRLVDRDGLRALHEEAGGPLRPSSVGWLVHEGVELAGDDAWFVEIEWFGDGFVPENGFSTRSREQMLADAQAAVAKLSGDQGAGAPDFRLVRYVEEPALDAGGDGATWAEELSYRGETEHRIDCHAAKLGRGGVLRFSIVGVDAGRRELCLRSVRVAAGRTAFARGHAYADHWWLFDRTAEYDLAAVVSGVTGPAL